MAEFESKKQFGAQMPHTAGMTCARCEQMLQDAMDGTLGAEEKAALDLHLVHCEGCNTRFVEAQRGLQWLTLLKQETPEPGSDLVSRILAATTGMDTHTDSGNTGTLGNVIAFRPKSGWSAQLQHMRSIAMQPRLAMTAAMAFFSIALTLNLLGVQMSRLSVSELKPASLRRSFWQANSAAVRYYDNLKVVYELQSRVQEMKGGSDANEGGSAPSEDRPEPQQQKKKNEQDKKPAGSSRKNEGRHDSLNALLVKDARHVALHKEVRA